MLQYFCTHCAVFPLFSNVNVHLDSCFYLLHLSLLQPLRMTKNTNVDLKVIQL